VKLREHRIAAKDTCKVALSTGAEPTVKGAGTILHGEAAHHGEMAH